MSHAPGVFREANLSAESGQSPQPMLVNQQLPGTFDGSRYPYLLKNLRVPSCNTQNGVQRH